MKNLNNVDFLLFDLGNVIVNLDYGFSIRELKKYLPEEKWDLGAGLYTANFHKEYERGMLDDSQFRQEVREYFGEQWSDDRIDSLWNSLLINIPVERIELVRELNKNFRTGILSNTNNIHIAAVNKILLRDTGEVSLENLFDHVFLSHKMGMSKPDAEIYQAVLADIRVEGKKVLFFDDIEENLIGAKEVGLQTYPIKNTDALIRFFQDVQ